MRIIEIAALSNGAHRNQTPNSLMVVPDGWAVVPDGMETPNFPFGSVTVEDVNGVPTVTAWIPGTMPEPEPEVEEVDTEAVIIETLIDQEIRIAELELMML